jgi:hypothetical protein
MGGVYRRKKYWHIWFVDQHKKRQYEHGSPKWTKKREAEAQLSIREAEVLKHEYKGKKIDEVDFEDLSRLLIEDYTINNRKSLTSQINRIKRMEKFFGKKEKAIHIPSRIKSFIIFCQNKGDSNAYINRYLSALQRMFSLGFNHEPQLVARIPKIIKLEENNVRKGFIDHEFYLRFKPELPDYLQIALLISYASTVRKTEVFTLKIHQFNKITGYVLLEETKNNEQRGFFLRGQFYQEVFDWVQKTEREYPECEYIVNLKGKRVTDFRTAWESALMRTGQKIRFKCKKCGNFEYLSLGEKREDLKCRSCKENKFKKANETIFHDIRRSAAKNMKNAGNPEEDIKQIGGWKTGSMFTRYNITGEEEQKSVADKTLEYLKKQEEEIRRHNK